LGKTFVLAIRRWLVAGLLIWFPLGATVLIFSLLLDISNELFFLIPTRYRPEALLGFEIPGLGLIFAVVVLLITGMFAANLLGRRLVAWYERILNRIPAVRSVYGALKNFTEVVFSDSGSSFKKVLLIEYPRKGLYSLCFQTSDKLAEVQARTGDRVVGVFLPTTPNPTSGFMLFVPLKEVQVLDMPVEDALKMIISLGVVVPDWHPVHPEHNLARSGGTP
jgi:uncharacterized membrane protein